MNINLDKVLLILLCFMPISIMIGKAALNLNLIFFDLLVILLLFQKKIFTNIKISRNFILAVLFSLIILINVILSVEINLSS